MLQSPSDLRRQATPPQLLIGLALICMMMFFGAWFQAAKAAPNAPIGKIRIIKTIIDGAVSPDPGQFYITVNNVAEPATCSNPPGPSCDVTHDVFASPVTIGEQAGPNTNLANYTTTMACYASATYPNGPIISSSATVDIGGTNPTEVTCVLTNTRRTGKIFVKKEVKDTSSPTGTNTDEFTILINGNLAPGAAFPYGNNEFSDRVIVNTGNQTVSEPDDPDYNTSITCYRVDNGVITNIAIAGPVSDPGGNNVDPTISNVPVDDNLNKDVACVVTNTRRVGAVEVIKKVVSPAGFVDTGKFDLQIDGITDLDANNIGNGGSTGKQILPANALYGIGENVDDPNTDINSYSASLSCYTRAVYNNGQPNGAPIVPTVANSAAIVTIGLPINEGDDIVCLITNTRKTGTLKVVKDIVNDPPQSLGKFNLLIDNANGTNLTTAADQGDNGATAMLTVPTGDYKVSETAGTGTSLAKYNSALACTGPVANATPTSGTVTVLDGTNVVCTFTNTRLPGNLTLIKDFVPAALGGDAFIFQVDGVNGATFSADTTVGPTTIAAGEHTVGEVPSGATNPANYAISTVCRDAANNAVVASAPNAGPLKVFIDSNASIVCTITNKPATLEIAKVGNPASVPGGLNFNFTVTGPNLPLTPFGVALGSSANSGPVLPGTYTYVETPVPGGWVLQDITCVGNAQSVITKNVAQATVTINLVAGENVKCTFRNVLRSRINLVKIATPADGTDFMFRVNGNLHGPIDDAVPDDNDSHADILSLGNLVPGIYNIDEEAVAGWALTGRNCTAVELTPPNNVVAVLWFQTANGVSLALPGNVDVTCTFINEKRATITVKKAADPADGTNFAFTASGPFGSPMPASFTLDNAVPNDNDNINDSITIQNLLPGQYNIAETLPAGWKIPNISCASDSVDNNVPITNGVQISLEPGENVTCTFNNGIKRGGITVIKEASPADGKDFDFDGGTLGTFKLDDGDADAIPSSKAFSNLLPGSYDIKEIVPGDWNLVSVACTGGNGNDVAIANGMRVVLEPDEQVTCKFRNVIKQSGITIIKESVPQSAMNFSINGGTLGTFDLDDPATDDNDGVTDTKVFANLNPGTYSFAEPIQIIPAGWDQIDLDCTGAVNSQVTIANNGVSINLKANEQIVCVFTNAKRGSIKIVKEATPADGTDFPFTFKGNNPINTPLNEAVTLDVDGQNNNPLADNKSYFDLVTGDYHISEAPPTGWVVTGRTCTGAVNSTISYNADGKTTDINLAPGENLVCTYKNSKQGSITIVKDAFPAGPTQFAFNGNLNPALFFLNDQDAADYHIGDALSGSSSRVFATLVPGSYNISEAVQGNGWAVTHIECSGGANVLVGSDGDFDLGDIGVTINLASGENVICEFANQFTVTSGLTLQKTVDPTTYNAVGQLLTYSFVIKNTGNTPLTGVQIQEGLAGVNISCPGFNGQLVSGQQTTCTGTYSVQQSDLDRGFIQNSAFAKAEGGVTSTPASALATAVQTPKITLVKSVTDNNGGDVVLSDVLTYKFEVTNNGNVTLSGVKVSDPLPTLSALSCTPAQPTTLAPGNKLICTATYTVQQADANAGLIQNTATAEGFDPGNAKRTAQHSATVTVKRSLSLNLKKSLNSNADEDRSGNVTLNDTLTYEFVVTNNSNVSVSNVKVVDPLTGFNGVCGSATLAAGASTSCTSTYKVKQSDIDRGQIVNIALASATDANNTQLSAPASATINLQQKASIDLEKSVTSNDADQSGGVSANDTLTYQFKVTNDGNVTLNAVGVTDPMPGLSALSCTPAQPTTLTPGQSMICTATYKVTAADVTAGKIKNTATATGIDAVTGPVASTDQVSVSTQQQLRLGLLKRVAQVTVNQDKSIGIVMEYTLQNQGNSPLTNLALFDDAASDFANFAPQDFSAANGSMSANQGWNGQGGTNVLAPFQSLDVGGQGTVYVGFNVTTNQAVQVQTTAKANAEGTQGDAVNESATAVVDLVGGQGQQPAGATVNGPTAVSSNSNVIVGWTTQAETRISGFRLYRSTDGTRANAQALGVTILSHGVAAGSSYTFIDSAVQPNTTYTYWLVVVAEGAEIAEHGPTSVTTPAGNPTQPAARSLYIPIVLKK